MMDGQSIVQWKNKYLIQTSNGSSEKEYGKCCIGDETFDQGHNLRIQRMQTLIVITKEEIDEFK